ncbi:MAG: ABC-type antimicrobial peptide transport system, ATPase component [Candidatus Hecatellales archaeon B24]|nr:MAG: ABC-type antimicrobial peptide transport system, ATPase component [Candidatus Hecatellales archaeon B24]
MMSPLKTAGETRYAAETVDLTKVYRSGAYKVYALRNVNIKIRRGEFLAVVGPSGSGKSTLLNLLGTLDQPTSGRILIDGFDTSKLSGGELARLRSRKIGFVFQAYNLINRTSVLRNLELPAMVLGVPAGERRRRALELLELMGLRQEAYRKPTELSGGEQQRVAIARALMNNPALVLADEPTGNLDSKTGRSIFELLRKLCHEQSATVIVVTHNLELASMTDRIIHLRDGMVIREEG